MGLLRFSIAVLYSNCAKPGGIAKGKDWRENAGVFIVGFKRKNFYLQTRQG